MKRKLTVKKLIILVLAVVFLCGFIRQEKTIRRIEEERVSKEAQLKEAQEKNERLQEEKSKSQSEDYVEKLARERLNMIKEGEFTTESKK